MMCGLDVTEKESKLHHHGGNEQRVRALVIERVDNHQGHQDDQWTHQQDNTLRLRLQWSKARVFKANKLEIEAEQQENEPGS